VPGQFRARAIPAAARELTLDLEFVPACHTLFHVLDRREGRGSLDSFELSVRAKDGSWSRDWQCSGYGFSAWMPVGPVIAKCTVYGSAPVVVHHELQGDDGEVPFTLR
jgi:hypothetical protein